MALNGNAAALQAQDKYGIVKTTLTIKQQITIQLIAASLGDGKTTFADIDDKFVQNAEAAADVILAELS